MTKEPIININLMKGYRSLSRDWITEGSIDLEYKSYLLLAYLQKVDIKFSHIELYPPLRDLIEHYNGLVKIRDGKNDITESAPKNPVRIDLAKLKIVYEGIEKGSDWMEELNKIIEFSIPVMKETIEKGKSIYEEVEKSIRINPIGVIPIDQHKGFIFFNTPEPGFIDVFEFRIEKMQFEGNPIKGIYTQFLESIKKGFSTLESIKTSLVRKYGPIYNPAAYLIDTDIWIPREATLMPIAKRKLLAIINI
jgi:hypothetical protein